MSEHDFERIDMDAELEAVYYEQKPDFAQVIFHNIAETYPTDAHVVCDYTITAALTATQRDWVGLYRVGWSSPRDFVFFLWSPAPKNYTPGTDAVNRVVFQAHCLPRDDGEFYQFCYVQSSGCVRGASTPFQFKQVVQEEYVEVEDGDIMMVKTKSAALEEDLSTAIGERALLEKELDHLTKERDGLVDELVTFKKELDREKSTHEQTNKQIHESIERVTQLEREADGLNKVQTSLREKLNTLNQEKTGLEKKIEEKDQYISSLQEKIKQLISEKDALTGRTKSLEQEKELFKNHFTTSESTMQKYQITVDEQKKALKAAQMEAEQLRAHVELLTVNVHSEKNDKDSAMATLHANKTIIEETGDKLRHAEDKLRASDEMVNMMKTETLAQIQVITKMSTDLEETKTEAYNMKLGTAKLEKDHKAEKTTWLDEKTELQANIKAQEKEIERLWKKLESLTEQAKDAESKTSTDQGSLFALQMAQASLKDRYTKMKEEHEQTLKLNDTLGKKVKHYRQQESDLRHEVSDLKERLSMGAEEYKVKYLEARALEVELRKLNKGKRLKSPSECKQTETEQVQRADAVTATSNHTTSETGTDSPKHLTSDRSTTTPQPDTMETGTTTPRRVTAEMGTITPKHVTSEIGTTTPKHVTSDIGTTTPQRVTTEMGTTTPQCVTADMGTTTPKHVTSEMGTTTPQHVTAEMGTTTHKHVTSEMGTATPKHVTSEMGTTTVLNSTTESGTITTECVTKETGTTTPCKVTHEASTCSNVATTDAATSSHVDTASVATHVAQKTSETGTDPAHYREVDEEMYQLTAQELMEDLMKEVRNKKTKLDHYKQRYINVKEHLNFLQKYYHNEIKKKKVPTATLR